MPTRKPPRKAVVKVRGRGYREKLDEQFFRGPGAAPSLPSASEASRRFNDERRLQRLEAEIARLKAGTPEAEAPKPDERLILADKIVQRSRIIVGVRERLAQTRIPKSSETAILSADIQAARAALYAATRVLEPATMATVRPSFAKDRETGEWKPVVHDGAQELDLGDTEVAAVDSRALLDPVWSNRS